MGLNFNPFDEERKEVNPHRIADLKANLNRSALEFLQWLFPEGKLKGHEFQVGTVEGGDGKSASFNITPGKEGVGGDFATGDFTGDLIDVYCKATGKSFKEALPELEGWAGVPTIKEAVDNPTIITSSLIPAGVDLSQVPTSEVTLYNYQDYDLNTILTIKKVAHSNGKKEFYPEFPDGSQTIPEGYLRPLYNLPGINGADTVVIVEGEKCVDYLMSLNLIPTTSIGGAAVPPEKTDWSPLEGKVIILWPDNDDAGMKHMKRIYDHLVKMNIPKILMVKPPRDADEKWDAADCEPKQVKKLLDAAGVVHRPIDIMAEEFSAKSYDEHPPKREYLIQGGFGMNSCSILAAEGGTGKSFMFLDLAVKVAYGTAMFDQAFGGMVAQNGNVVFLSAEDGRPDIHERINMVDVAQPPRRFKDSKYELRIIPMPSLGVTFPLFYMKDGQLTESDNWTRIREAILEMNDVKLIILDPLSMLVHADVNADPAMGSMVCAEFNRLAVETGSAVLISHHFSKGNYDIDITTPEQARQHVRGTTALVDSARNTFCVWKTTESQGKKICEEKSIEWERNLIYMGATVKSNYLTDSGIKILRRDPVTGVLTCIDDNFDVSTKELQRGDSRTVEMEILRVVKERGLAGKPFQTNAGPNQITVMDINKDYRGMLHGKTIYDIIGDLVDRDEIVKKIGTYVIDVKGGAMYNQWKETGDIKAYLLTKESE